MNIHIIKTIKITDNIQFHLARIPQGTFFMRGRVIFTPDQVSEVCKKAIAAGITTKEELEINL